MAALLLRHRDLSQILPVDWLLILTGALFAWLFWPASPH